MSVQFVSLVATAATPTSPNNFTCLTVDAVLNYVPPGGWNATASYERSAVNDRVLALLKAYDLRLETLGYRNVNHSDVKHPDRTEQLEHVRWMIGQFFNPTEPRLSEKFNKERTVNRWLGFIQGALNSNGIYSVQELRDQSRHLYDDE